MMAKTLDEIYALSERALLRHGAAPWVAAHVADAVKVAESFGNKICGLYYLESYCQQLESGRVKGDVEPDVRRVRPAVVHVDARFGFAQPAFARALPEALSAARECGVASLAVGHAHTCTSLGYFTEQIARAGMIGIGMTNASPIVAPPGGKSRVIGTNPMAFAVPDGAGGVAMMFDQSTTTVALGAVGTSPRYCGPNLKGRSSGVITHHPRAGSPVRGGASIPQPDSSVADPKRNAAHRPTPAKSTDKLGLRS